MSDKSDNACGNDQEMEATDAIDQSVEITQLLQQFGEQTLKMIELHNRHMNSAEIVNQRTFKQTLDEKMRLLCGLNKPQLIPKMTLLLQIMKKHSEILQHFGKLYNSEDDYMRAYVQHCDEAIDNKTNSGAPAEFDEFTTMPHANLENFITQVQTQQINVKAANETLRANRFKKQKEYEAKYNAIINEIEELEKYDMDAHETLDLLKSEVQQMQIQ